MSFPKTPSPIQKISDPVFEEYGITVLVKRDDLIHEEVMGNKWRKLKYNIEYAVERGTKSLVTFGGAYSNHIAATAAAAKLYGLDSVGIIRGEELTADSNPTLRRAAENGMKFQFVSREDYREMKQGNQVPKESLSNYVVLPEGGTNELAIKGCAELIDEIDHDFDILISPVGTGGTIAGLLKGLGGNQMIYGFSALRGKWITEDFKSLLQTHNIKYENFKIFEDKRFGGYCKYDLDLIQFILDFKQKYDILLDPIYTGKMFFNVWELVKNAQIANNTTLLMLHTGGLQAITGFNHRFNLALPRP